MLIKWLGHASFQIFSGNTKIITDPFDDQLGYPIFPREADIVTISHQHWDHNSAESISGNPQVLAEPGLYRDNDFIINGYSTYHDKQQGRERGTNTIFKFCAEGINLLHLGDLGHVLSQKQVEEVGPIDILLLPVGGRYTIGPDEAYELVQLLTPQLVIPMHFMTPHLSFTLAPVEEFISKFERMLKLPCLNIEKQDLQGEQKIIVLDYLLG